MLKRNSVDLLITLGNKCLHECVNYCLLDGNKNGLSIDFSKYTEFLDKYEDELKYLRYMFFLGQDMFTMNNVGDFFEEGLKRRIYNYRIVTRGGISTEENNAKISIIKKLKNIYPNFDLSMTISLDNFSTANKNDKEKIIENYFNLLMLQFTVFGKQNIYFQATGSVNKNENGFSLKEKDLTFFQDIINGILDKLEREGIKHIHTEEEPNILKLHLDNGNIITIIIGVHKNTHGKDYIQNISVSEKEDVFKKRCSNIYETFRIYIDKNFNVTECSSFHGMYKGNKNIVTNTLNESKEIVFKKILEIKRKYFEILTYSELIEHLLCSDGERICNRLNNEKK